MKPQSVKERSKIAEGRERAPWGTDAQRGAGDPVEHPDRNDRSRAIWHLADRHQLAATVLGVEDGHALPDERVPGVVNLASVTDTGRMKRSLLLHEKCAAAATALGAGLRRNRSWRRSCAPRTSEDSIVPTSSPRCFARRRRSSHRISIRQANPSADAVTNYRNSSCVGTACGETSCHASKSSMDLETPLGKTYFGSSPLSSAGRMSRAR